MKYRLLSIIVLISAYHLKAQQEFELLWQENFDSTQIDYSRWSNSYSWGRTITTNKELEYYTDGENFELKDGYLIIEPRRQKTKARVDPSAPANKKMEDSLLNERFFNYTSGLLRSREKYLYGKFEIRCKLPAGNGTWPAFWLYGGDCGEIDVFEKPWIFHYSITNNLHYDSAGIKRSDFCVTPLKDPINIRQGFHTYSIEWTPDKITWFIDDRPLRIATYHFADCPMELIFNLALANDDFWGHTHGRISKKSNFEIDYVKVWKLKNQP
jgi:beta-glucanase (GH16 family)